MVVKPKIVAAIPAYNVEQFIGEVVRHVSQFVDQVVVVNDGSTDNTAQVAQAAGALIVNHRTRQGYGGSIKTCFESVKTNAADILVTLDGDAQHDPDEIQRVVAPILSDKADIVIGSRFLSSQKNMPGYRGFGIRIITFLFNFGSKVRVSDAQSGFRAYSRRVLNAISTTEVGMSVSVETLIKARASGFRIKEVPISCRYHPNSSSINPITHGLGVALSAIKQRIGILLFKIRSRLHLAI